MKTLFIFLAFMMAAIFSGAQSREQTIQEMEIYKLIRKHDMKYMPVERIAFADNKKSIFEKEIDAGERIAIPVKPVTGTEHYIGR